MFAGLAMAQDQNDAIGFSTNHVFHGVINGENVDVMTGNLNIALPLGPRYRLNEWFGYQLKLYYNSKIWEYNCPQSTSCAGETMGPDTFGQGFNLHFGRVYHHPRDKFDALG